MMIPAGSITYVPTTFHAIEEFDDARHNTYPVKNTDPLFHTMLNPKDIAPSLHRASPKQVLDFMVEHSGTFRKKHSTISCVRAYYLASRQDCKFVGFQAQTEISLEKYIALGKPESFTLHRTIEIS